jgi:hypothetical protein
MAGTSKAQASNARHLSRASASDPEEKPTESSFTFSMKARIASSVFSSAATAGIIGQAKISARKSVGMRRVAAAPDFDLPQTP